MRHTTTFLFVFLSIGSFACASSDSSGTGSTETNKPQPPGGNGTETNPTEPEKPLTARAVCETIATDSTFGNGCSGTGSGQEVCAFESSQCGTNKCVYDTRKDGFFDFYCAPKCNATDDSVACPLGYECVTPTPSCAGDAAEGVCTKRVDFDCVDAGDASGAFVEGVDGSLLVVKVTTGQGSLRQRTKTGWRTLTTWSDASGGSGGISGVARSGNRMLIASGSYEIVIEDGVAKAAKRDSTETYSTMLGVAADGSFISLLNTSGSYATLSKRGDDGKWTEVGPTRKRVANLAPLGKGFIARCAEELCTSADGENFEAIAAPPDVALTATTAFASAGLSTEDFYLAVEGRLFHHRKGKWVVEGPRAAEPSASSSSSYPDRVRVSTSGAVAFFTRDTTPGQYGYTTYTRTSEGECWKTTNENNLESATLVGDDIMWATYAQGDLCTLKIQ